MVRIYNLFHINTHMYMHAHALCLTGHGVVESLRGARVGLKVLAVSRPVEVSDEAGAATALADLLVAPPPSSSSCSNYIIATSHNDIIMTSLPPPLTE